MYPNVQAYDRGMMFSPDGQLFQVEYAKAAVRKGATAVGIVARDSIVLAAHKNITEPLVVPQTFQKIFRVDSHIGSTYSGIVSDGLHLIGSMRNKTQTHRMVYNETESVETLAREISDDMQVATQYGGVRPYAVSLLIGGINASPMLFEVDPSATPMGYKADAIGMGKKQAGEILASGYKDGMSVDNAITLGIEAIKKSAEAKIKENNLDVSIITRSNGFEVLGPEKIATYL